MPGSSRVLVLLLVTGCVSSAGSPPPPARSVPVRVEPVTVERIVRPVHAVGVLGAKEVVELGFKVGGVIARIAVDGGDRVARGDLLAALDLREIEAQVAKARSALAKAERDLARARELHADSVVTRTQLQDAETAAEVARADLETAEFNQRYASIRAPAAGVVLRRLADPGELVAPGSPVLVLGADTRGTVLRVGLADRDAMRVRLGDSAWVTLDAQPGRRLRGRVAEVAAAADPRSGTYAVEIGVEEARGLPSGLVGRVEIRPSSSQEMYLIPVTALVEADGDRATVYTLDENATRARRVPVTVAFPEGDRVAVREGLDGVETVVTHGAAYLEDGAPVRVAR